MPTLKNFPKLEKRLWPHQTQAITGFKTYLTQFEQRANIGSYLIRMPTGTGKSGVIAVFSRCFVEYKNILVITPWITIRGQLTKDIRARFWETIGFKGRLDVKNFWPKEVFEFVPSLLQPSSHTSSGENGTVFTCTVQTLQLLHTNENYKQLYTWLKKNVAMVLVDEGHREPAPEWAESVRKLGKPTALFTATPYRNDYKLFDVRPNNYFSFPHELAVKNRYVRRVQFKNVRFGYSRKEFVKSFLKYFREEFVPNTPIKNPRVIIRCSNSDEINEITSLLNKEGELAIGLHENFQEHGKPNYLRKTVPDPKDVDFNFWVHQNKLIEGIDDSRFCLLAIFKPLRNGRALVQQIGRIIRSSSRLKNEIAIVFTHPEDNQEDFWNNYLEYEKFSNEEGADFQKLELENILNNTISVQPKYAYIQGNFRRRLDFSDENLYKDLGYSKSANIFINSPRVSLDTLKDSISDEWAKKDLVVRKQEQPDKFSRLLIYQKQYTSTFIRNRYFIEFSIGYTLIRSHDGLLFYFDSESNSSEFIYGNYEFLASAELLRLISSKGSKVRQISLRNLDIGRQNIRRRTISTTSLEDTLVQLNDHAQFATTLSGLAATDLEGPTNRYIGLSRSRISEPAAQKVRFDQYIDWLDAITTVIKSEKIQTLPALKRYAQPTSKAQSPHTPISIQLDLHEFADLFMHIDNEREFSVVDTYSEIENHKGSRTFTLEVIVDDKSTREYRLRISLNPKTKRFRFESPELSKTFVRKDPATNQTIENIVSYLNRVQPFRLGFDNPNLVYSYGRFVEPMLKIFTKEKDDELGLMTLLESVADLNTVSSEKGSACQPKGLGWERGSLFDIIDTKFKSLGEFDSFICDDLGTEMADFVGVSTLHKQVVLIHAKVKKAKYSATAFQDVCWQAIKNLGWLNPYIPGLRAPITKWSEPWEIEGVGRVENRERLGPVDAQKTWNNFQKIIHDPQAQKEVWVILGKGFSRIEFEKKRRQDKPPPEIVQIFHVLQSTWNTVDSVGARLRVFVPD